MAGSDPTTHDELATVINQLRLELDDMHRTRGRTPPTTRPALPT